MQRGDWLQQVETPMADLGNAAIFRETLTRVAEGPVSLQHAVNANERQNDD